MRDSELSADLERVRHQINLAQSQLTQQNKLKAKAPNESKQNPELLVQILKPAHEGKTS
jgi:hypothetical protein